MSIEQNVRQIVCVVALLTSSAVTQAQTVQTDPLSYSVATPRPINPAEGTTNPSAQATQTLNPYLGSIPGTVVAGELRLSMREAIDRGLRYNLGLVESNQASADVRADRLRALSDLLPQLSAGFTQAYDSISFQEIGLKLPSIPGFPGLPATTGGFGYEDTRVRVKETFYSAELRNRYKARKADERASAFSVEDSRDVVVFAVGTAYLRVVASTARVETARAQLASAQELDNQIANQVKAEVSPEIDSLRAQVGEQTAEQRLLNDMNQLEKDKLTLARITGLAVQQAFALSDTALTAKPFLALTQESATEEALHSRSDLASARERIGAAELVLASARGQRTPTVSVNADYGAGGSTLGNADPVYTVAASVSVPIFTGGRIRADIDQAKADLGRRHAEYADLAGRVGYDVRIAWLDLTASESSVRVASRNKELATRAITQSRDRYANGVANYLEVVDAEQAFSAANENLIESLYSYNVAEFALVRAMGASKTRLQQLLGGN